LIIHPRLLQLWQINAAGKTGAVQLLKRQPSLKRMIERPENTW